MTPRQEFELEELASLITEAEDGENAIDLLAENFNIGWRDFKKIVELLIPYTVKAQIATLDGSEECAQGFVHDGAFIVKRVVDCSA